MKIVKVTCKKKTDKWGNVRYYYGKFKKPVTVKNGETLKVISTIVL